MPTAVARSCTPLPWRRRTDWFSDSVSRPGYDSGAIVDTLRLRTEVRDPSNGYIPVPVHVPRRVLSALRASVALPCGERCHNRLPFRSATTTGGRTNALSTAGSDHFDGPNRHLQNLNVSKTSFLEATHWTLVRVKTNHLAFAPETIGKRAARQPVIPSGMSHMLRYPNVPASLAAKGEAPHSGL